jgi:hypothetical protein
MLPSGNRFAPAVNEGHFCKVFHFRWANGKSQKFYGGTMALLGKPMSFPAGPWSHRKTFGISRLASGNGKLCGNDLHDRLILVLTMAEHHICI